MFQLDKEKEALLTKLVPGADELRKTDEGVDAILSALDSAMLDALGSDFEPTKQSGQICKLYDEIVWQERHPNGITEDEWIKRQNTTIRGC